MSHTYQSVETSTADFASRGHSFVRGLILAAIERHGSCMLGLSGGSTPGPIYELLGKDKSIDWSKVDVFLVDERYISASSKDANAHLVRSTLLASGIEPHSVLFPDASFPLEECVKSYAEDVSTLLKRHGRPCDVMLLGMGPDYHTASLFPPLADGILSSEEVAIHTTQDRRFPVYDRISLTLKIICQSTRHVYLLKGADKGPVWHAMVHASHDPHQFPVHSVLSEGRTTLLYGHD